MPRSGAAVVEVSETVIATGDGVLPSWNAWPVSWTAVWVGTLASVAAVVVFGLIGIALGAHVMSDETRWVTLRDTGRWSMIFSVVAAFFAFVIGGWITGKIAGILRSETGMLHGAITWLVSLPILLVLLALGAGGAVGGWQAGLGGRPAWASAQQPPYLAPLEPGTSAEAAERERYREELAKHRQRVQQWHEDTPRVARNTALGAVTVLLLGLVGGVLGGWMASGEPMNFTHYRTREEATAKPSRKS